MKTETEAFQDIAQELRERGAVDDAAQLEQIASMRTTGMSSQVVEAMRLLNSVQTKASKDPNLMNIAARASLLSHQIQQHYSQQEVTDGN